MVFIQNEFHKQEFRCIVWQTLNDWDTDKNTKKHMIPLAGQIPRKPLCQQTLTQAFSWDNGEEFRRKERHFKTENIM
jgi:hypothetical protein